MVTTGRGPGQGGLPGSVNVADFLRTLFSPLEIVLPFFSQGKWDVAWFHISDRYIGA